jgi:hypothetical protein
VPPCREIEFKAKPDRAVSNHPAKQWSMEQYLSGGLACTAAAGRPDRHGGAVPDLPGSMIEYPVASGLMHDKS